MLRFLILISATVLLSACAATPKMNDLRLGMTRNQVEDVMGAPDSTSAKGDSVYLNYNLWRDFWDRRPGDYSDKYFVRLVVIFQ